VDDVENNELDVDIVEANISINNLANAPSSDVVGIDDNQTLTNKTIDSNTNIVTANKLKTATTVVDISNSDAPSVGQVLMATGNTTAIWQTLPEGGNGEIDIQNVSASTTVSTTSETAIDLDSMTLNTNSTSNKKYIINFVAQFTKSKNGDCLFHLLVDDVVKQTMTLYASKNKYVEVVLSYATGELANGTEVKIQFNTDNKKETISVVERNLSIFGIS
jgi:hypothetical protein